MQDGRPSSGSELLAPARMEASFSSMAAEVLHGKQHDAGRNRRISERRKNNRRGLLGQSRNAGNFFRANVAEIEHHAQRRFGFLHAIGRQAECCACTLPPRN